MRYRLLLMLAALPAMGFAQDLTVSLEADSAISSSIRNTLKREVETLVAPSGIRVVWHENNGAPDAERLAVIRLNGLCSSAPVFKAVSVKAESLGKTHVVNGQVLPIAQISCDSVRNFISTELSRTRSEQRDEMFGRALGRVMSHELYHILLRTTSHGREGIARPAQRSAELVMERAAFARADERRLASISGDESSDADSGSGR